MRVYRMRIRIPEGFVLVDLRFLKRDFGPCASRKCGRSGRGLGGVVLVLVARRKPSRVVVGGQLRDVSLVSVVTDG
jgi:hypothetical protein